MTFSRSHKKWRIWNLNLGPCVVLCLLIALLEEWKIANNLETHSVTSEGAHVPETNVPLSKSFRAQPLETHFTFPWPPKRRGKQIWSYLIALLRSVFIKRERLSLAMTALTSVYVVVHLLSRIWLFVTPCTAARQASLSWRWFSQSLLKLMSIESVMPSNHLILCCPLSLLPSIFPSLRVFSNESALCFRWPKALELQLQHQSFQGILGWFP